MRLLSEGAGWALTESRLLWTDNSGGRWKDITPALSDGRLLTAFFVDASNGWGVLAVPGAGGGANSLSLASTSDGGNSWSFSELLSASDDTLYEASDVVSVHFVNGVHGWVLIKLVSGSNFSRGLLLETADGGRSWKKLPPPPAGDSVRFVTAQDGWLAGGPEANRLYVTRDGGQTWSQLSVEPPPGIGRDVTEANFDLPTFQNQYEGVLPVTFGEGGLVALYATGDGGRNWRFRQSIPISGGVSRSSRAATAVVAQDVFVVAPPGGLGFTGIKGGTTGSKSALVKDLSRDAVISGLDFNSADDGWLLIGEGQCVGFKSGCAQTTRLFVTHDGGGTLTDITPRVQSRTEPAGVTAFGANAVSTSRNRKGFDKCSADSVNNMKVWWDNSPYFDANIYIGGANRTCTQPNLTSSWVGQTFSQGWSLIPTWVGPQATCTTCATCSVISSNTTTAASQGVAEANSAANAASALGLTNTVIYYDMERYNPTTSCQSSVRAFLNAWVQQMHARGNLAGVYGSPQNAQEDWSVIANPPDAVWIAKWDGNASVFGLTPLSDSLWVGDQRIHQYQGGHNETYGGVTFNIDNDFDDAPVASGVAQSQPNVTPYKPSGWSDKIVASTTTGTSTDASTFKTTDSIYVDWAVINNGAAATGVAFYSKLYVDGVERNTWVTNPPLDVNFFSFAQDYFVGSLSAGSHTIKIVTDATGVLAESSESDNEYTKTITVVSPGQPNLTPYLPSGWSDKLVVSTTTGTSTDGSPLKTTDTLYVDWAVINNGTAATDATFYTRLYVDGVEKTFWFTNPPLNVNNYAFIQDYSIGSLSAGTHTVKLVTDATGTIPESNESDNEYTKTITVASQPSCLTLTTNVSPAGGGTINRNIQPNCSGGGLAESQPDTRPMQAQEPGETGVGLSLGMQRTAADEETFRRLINKVAESGSVRVIVGLNTSFTPEGALSATEAQSQHANISRAQDGLLSRLSVFGVQSVKKFPSIPYMALEVDADALRYMEASSDVNSIEEDVAVPPTLAQSVPLIGAPAAWAAGYTGAGQAVAILDTGVDGSHSFLSGKVVSQACYSTSGSNSTSVCPGGVSQSTSSGSGVNCNTSISGCDHGTHVAGIAAGKGTSFSGVAKDASIIAIQVFSRFDNPADCGDSPAPCARTFTSDQILGLQRVQALSGSFNIAAANMSLGGGRNFSNCDSSESSRKAAIDNLRSLGIATVISSGNDGYTDSMGSPGCISTAISVGSTDDGSSGTTTDAVSSFSNSASFLNLLAPGRWINSSVPGGGFENFQGTSMAAPHVTGAWAILKSKAPSASVSQVLSALTTTGVPVTDSRNNITKPRIKVDAALNALAGGGQYTQGTGVTLTAVPSAGYTFQSWSGCDSTSGTNCTVTMNAVKSVTANFTANPPAAPSAGAATNVTGGGFTANWGASGGATGYRLDVSTSNTFGSYVSGYQNLDVGNVSSRSVSGLSAGTTYYYRVRAYNGAGTSGNSGVISVTTSAPSLISVTVGTSPSGLSFTVDGITYTSAQTLQWAAGSSHTIGTTSPQSGGTGTRYVWGGWSDGGAVSHTVAPPVGTTYTANFTKQYFLTMNAGSGGAVSPASNWYNSGQAVSISAIPNAGFTFAGWSGSGTGSYTGASNPASVTMNGPVTETASFTQTPVNSNGLQYYPLAHPVRLLDTRAGQSACYTPGVPLNGNATRTQAAAGTCEGLSIPSNAKAVVGNAAVVNNLAGAGSGFVTLYPSGVARPLAANVNYTPGQVVSNAFTVGLGADGAFNIYSYTKLDIVVDITGYYAPPGAGGLYYHPLPKPVRLLDTRIGQSACDAPGAPIVGGSSRNESARMTCGGVILPNDAKAVAGNAAVVNTLAGASSGHVTIYPGGVARPVTANINYSPGQVVSNAFTVGLGSDGTFNIYAYTTLHVVVDVSGYYSASAAADANGVAGMLYYPLASPMRLLDTRAGQSACYTPGLPLAADGVWTQNARLTCGALTVPSGAKAVVGNAAVVNTLNGSGSGHVVLYPSGVARPLAANVNYTPGQVVSNAFTVGLGADGAFNIYTYSSLHFVADISGYFAP